jgi:nicotinate-nucleotide--dimethylbenzimidazole phosphoribosyltransferase
MVNFTRGGGGVNMFCRQHGFDLTIVDVGVDYDLSPYPAILNRKIAPGTRNFLYEPAMSEDEFDQAINVGCELVDACHAKDSNIICIGEMGIGNTSPSSIWMSLFCHIPLDECIGAGAGLSDAGIRHKYEVLSQAVAKWNALAAANRFFSTLSQSEATERNSSLFTLHSSLQYFGGFEMVAAIGAMLRAAELRMLVMVDGFIMTACALGAVQLYPAAQDYMIFGHCGDESGHRRMLDALGARPLLNLGLRLGEGTGALCAYPIIDSAVRMVNEMNNFDNAKITKYF